jgi:hypothetical protein
MIIETIFSTLDTAGHPNFAPMGIVWGEEAMTVCPFRDTITYRNLVEVGCGVANVTDNVLSFVHTALSDRQLPHFPARHIRGVVLEEACTWRELEVADVGGDEQRARVHCRVVGEGRLRDFLGFNRGKNAVIEAAILATRLHLNSAADVRSALQRYDDLVDRTGGKQEREAMQHIQDYIARWFRAREG